VLWTDATALRPLVISRDGSNLLQGFLSDLPEQSVSAGGGEGAGVRAWLRRVFELNIERRVAGRPAQRRRARTQISGWRTILRLAQRPGCY
jgi:hypothetical protein